MSSRNSLRSHDGGRPFSANRTQMPTENKDEVACYPEIKQRGYYSDILEHNAENRLGNIYAGPNTEQDTLWKISKEDHTPLVTSFKGASDFNGALKSQVYGPTSQITTESDFPEKSFLPKVQLPYFVPPGHCPRKIEIERRKRLYQSQDLEDLLEKMNIETDLLMPKELGENFKVKLNETNEEDPAPFPAFLQLDIFTDMEFDCRTPDEWLELGVVNGDRLPIPAKALLPAWDSTDKLDPKDPSLEYEWFDVGVLDYDPEESLWLVQKTDLNGRILDQNNQVVINGGIQDGLRQPLQAAQYWIPRIQVMFISEDPAAFAQTVAQAFDDRRHTEAALR